MQKRLSIGILLLAVLGSCGNPPPVNIAGSWSGNWKSNNNVNQGSFALNQLVQDKTAVTGQAVLGSSPCFSTGTVTATVSGNAFSGTITTTTIEVKVNATLENNTLKGSYESVKNPLSQCVGDKGAFTAIPAP
jgi:hypothetical protein